MIGASLVLTLPRLTGALHGYPYEAESLERVVRSPLRYLYGALPAALRERALRSIPATRGVSAAYAGPPSVAHAEALASRLPVHILEQTGHLPHMENAGEVNRLIKRLIENQA